MIGIALALAIGLSPFMVVENPTAHRIVARVAAAGWSTGRTEARDLFRLAHLESRWNPAAESTEHACGIWQQQPRWAKTTCRALQTRPVHAAMVAIQTTRQMRAICKGAWLVCYQHGPYSVVGRAARRAVASRE